MLRIDIFPPSNVVETTHSSEGQRTMLQNWNRWKPCLCLFVPGVVLMSWYTGWCLIRKSYVLGKNFCKTNKCYTIIPAKCFILLPHNYAQNKMYQHNVVNPIHLVLKFTGLRAVWRTFYPLKRLKAKPWSGSSRLAGWSWSIFINVSREGALPEIVDPVVDRHITCLVPDSPCKEPGTQAWN